MPAPWVPGGGGGSDHKVLVDSSDSTPGYLGAKLIGSDTITINVIGVGDEQLELEATTAAATPLTNVAFVDSGYSGGSSNGSIEAPYLNIHDAIASGASPLQVMLLSPDETNEALTVPPGFNIAITAGGVHDAPGALSSLTLGLGSKVQLDNVNPGDVSAPAGQTCFLSLNFPFGNGTEAGFTTPNTGAIDATGCVVQAFGAGFASDVSVASLYAERCALGSGGNDVTMTTTGGQTYINSTFNNGVDALTVIAGGPVNLKISDVATVTDFTGCLSGVFADGWSWSTFTASLSTGPLNVKNELQNQGSDGTLLAGAILEATGSNITAGGGGGSSAIIQISEDGTTGGFSLLSGANYVLQGGGGSPVECTFDSWADGDILYIEWQLFGTDFDGGGSGLKAGVRVSLDGGTTFLFANPASASGESYNDPGGYVSTLNGVLSVPISGTTPPIIRLGYSLFGGLVELSGPAGDYTTGAVLHCERRASSIYKGSPPGALY